MSEPSAEWLAALTPEQHEAYLVGRRAMSSVIKRQAEQIIAYSTILKRIARGEANDPAYLARRILDTHKAPESE